MVKSISGVLINDVVINNTKSLPENDALQMAMNDVNAAEYMWENEQEENWLKERSGESGSTYKPKGELVLYANSDETAISTFSYALRFDVYAKTPQQRFLVYVDAENGRILTKQNMFHGIDSTGVGNTAYSGKKEITTEFMNSEFRLREDSRGNGIVTMNLQNSTDFSSAIDFTNDDNNWYITIQPLEI